jgi:hypothetical protein
VPLPVEDWLSGDEAVRTQRPRFAAAARFPTRRVLAVGVLALALALLFIGLAAVGGFSSPSGSRASKPSTPAPKTSTPSTRAQLPFRPRFPATVLKPRRQVASRFVVYEPVEVVFRGCRGARAVGERGATADGIFGPATRAALARAAHLSC